MLGIAVVNCANFWLKVDWISGFYFAPYSLEYESKILLSNGCVFYPIFANWVRTKNDVDSHFWMWKLFSLNCSKFAVECNWNSKNSQNIQNSGSFWKNRLDGFFRKKSWNFSKSLIGQLFSRTHPNGIIA